MCENYYVAAQNLSSNELVTMRSNEMLDLSSRNRKGLRVKKCVPFKPSNKGNFKKRRPYGRLVAGKIHKYFILGMEETEELLNLETMKKIQHNPSGDDLENIEDYAHDKELLQKMDDVTMEGNNEMEPPQKTNEDGAGAHLNDNFGNIIEPPHFEESTKSMDNSTGSYLKPHYSVDEEASKENHPSPGSSTVANMNAHENKEDLPKVDDVTIEGNNEMEPPQKTNEDGTGAHLNDSFGNSIEPPHFEESTKNMDNSTDSYLKPDDVTMEGHKETNEDSAGPSQIDDDVQQPKLPPHFQDLCRKVEEMLNNMKEEIIRHIYLAAAGATIEPTQPKDITEPTQTKSASEGTSTGPVQQTYVAFADSQKYTISTKAAFDILAENSSDTQKITKLTGLLLGGTDMLKTYVLSSQQVKNDPEKKLFSFKLSQLLADIYNDYTQKCRTKEDEINGVTSVKLTIADINDKLKRVMYKFRKGL